MHELTSIAFSHYVEKARWALDRFGVPYVEHRYLPLFHFAPVYRLHRGSSGRADSASTRFSTPVLRTPGGELLCDSAAIVRYASERFAPAGHDLYPTPEIARFEQRVHDELGPHARRAAYGACFADPSLLGDLARNNVGRLQARSFIAAMPLIVRAMRAALSIDDARVARSIEKVRGELQAISALLADGRPYLFGQRFSAADLALACMAAPIVFPPEFGAWLPPLERLPREARALCDEARATRAGQHALRMFRDERRRVVSGIKDPPSARDSSR